MCGCNHCFNKTRSGTDSCEGGYGCAPAQSRFRSAMCGRRLRRRYVGGRYRSGRLRTWKVWLRAAANIVEGIMEIERENRSPERESSSIDTILPPLPTASPKMNESAEFEYEHTAKTTTTRKLCRLSGCQVCVPPFASPDYIDPVQMKETEEERGVVGVVLILFHAAFTSPNMTLFPPSFSYPVCLMTGWDKHNEWIRFKLFLVFICKWGPRLHSIRVEDGLIFDRPVRLLSFSLKVSPNQVVILQGMTFTLVPPVWGFSLLLHRDKLRVKNKVVVVYLCQFVGVGALERSVSWPIRKKKQVSHLCVCVCGNTKLFLAIVRLLTHDWTAKTNLKSSQSRVNPQMQMAL